MVSLIKQWLAVGALLLIATPVDAEVVSLTLGIRMNCPYGLAG
ncbi:MAG: hypothetical protein SFU56_04320 [Capsulimonadales bacterium]|nr:hypothetical protein [Capsulimonadales bacterium]